MSSHRELSLFGREQQGLQALAVQAVGLPEVVYVQSVGHASSALSNAEEVPLGMSAGAAVWRQPQLILLDRHLQVTSQAVLQAVPKLGLFGQLAHNSFAILFALKLRCTPQVPLVYTDWRVTVNAVLEAY